MTKDRTTDDSAAEQNAVYVDNEGDAWRGNADGTLSLLEPVGDDDRYAHWTVPQVESLGLTLRKVHSDDNA